MDHHEESEAEHEPRSEAEIRADMEDTDRELRAVDALVAGEDPDEVERKWPSR